ncbi:deoxycytidyl transferase, partial [Ascoidea rubescens DSM 1968]
EREFGDYKSYFVNKQLKQQKADQEFVKWEQKRNPNNKNYIPIFKNCIVYINGYTNPNSQTLRKLVTLYGGKYSSTENPMVTHIIATKLTPRKLTLLKYRKVVKPEWIVDSIKNQNLMNWRIYSLLNSKTFSGTKVTDKIPVHNNVPNQKKYFDKEKTCNQEHQVQKDSTISKNIDSKDPEFLKYYFSNSRLHHLSTWKSDLKSEFVEKAIEVNLQQNNLLKMKTSVSTSNSIVLHIDFDCFFAKVSSLNYPNIDFEKFPVCVSHGSGTSDISSCNYVCRKFGIKNGMWVQNAKKICPNLICLKYNFVNYEKISRTFYDYLLQNIQFNSILPVSIDEVLLDVNCESKSDIDILAEKIRNDILQLTKCTISVGASTNVLLAKLSLKKAKPNGYFFLNSEDHLFLETFLNNTLVRDLPGVGRSTIERFQKELGSNCLNPIKIGNIKKINKGRFISIFGNKTGSKFYDYTRGVDHFSISKEINKIRFDANKSVSIDVNWGVRFDHWKQVETFLTSLSQELVNRMKKIKKVGSTLVLKIMKRAPNAPVVPPKFLGMGECVQLSKSSKIGLPTNDVGIISTEAKCLLRLINCNPIEIRGVGIQMKNL